MSGIGDELIYRLRDYSVSEHVRVVEIDGRKKTPRYVVEFVDGDKVGEQENVPGGRLRGPWSDVAAYDELMANWERIDQVELTVPEQSAVGQVFDLLISEEVAEYEWSPVRYATAAADQSPPASRARAREETWRVAEAGRLAHLLELGRPLCGATDPGPWRAVAGAVRCAACVERGCAEPAGTLWGPLWCPDHDRQVPDRSADLIGGTEHQALVRDLYADTRG